MFMMERCADMKRRERECEEEREEEEGGEMRERGSLAHYLECKHSFQDHVSFSLPPVFGCGDDV